MINKTVGEPVFIISDVYKRQVYKVSVEDNGLTGEDEDILNYDDIDDPDAFA